VAGLIVDPATSVQGSIHRADGDTGQLRDQANSTPFLFQTRALNGGNGIRYYFTLRER
jgi:hypothetical protein